MQGMQMGYLHEVSKKDAIGYLVKQGLDATLLENLLNEGYLISGSMILKMLTNASWVSKDIDFFLMLPKLYQEEQLVERIKNTFKPSGDYVSVDLALFERYHDAFCDRFGNVLQTKITSFHFTLEGLNKEINVIMGLETNKTTEEFILNEFDFDLCANWISKEGVFTKVKDLSDTSKIITIHSNMMKKLAEHQQTFRDYFGLDRSTPLYVDDLISILYNYELRYYKRLLKYRQRGFIFPQVIEAPTSK